MTIQRLGIPDRFFGQLLPVAPDMNQVVDKIDELVNAVNAGLTTSNALAGGPKFVRYRRSALYGLTPADLTLDSLDPDSILPGNEAVVLNPADNPTQQTEPPKRYVATLAAASDPGAVSVPATTGGQDRVFITWQEADESSSDYTPLLASELDSNKAAYANLGLRKLLIKLVNQLNTATSTTVLTPVAPAPSPAPTVTGFLPASGAVGTSITLTGTNFSKATAVTFNGTTASFQPLNATTIVAVVPVGATNGTVSVVSAAGTGTSTASFTVTAGSGGGGTTPTPQPTAALALSLAQITLGASVGYSITPTNGTAPYSYQVTAVDVVTGNTFDLGTTKSGTWQPPAVAQYQVEATVTDSSNPAQVVQTAVRYLNVVAPANRPPVVSAGQGTTIQLPTSSVTLQGTATDPDTGDTIASHAWRLVSGPSVPGGVPATTQNVTVTGLVAGTYQFAYRATDNHGAQSDEAYVTITVTPASTTPGMGYDPSKDNTLLLAGDSTATNDYVPETSAIFLAALGNAVLAGGGTGTFSNAAGRFWQTSRSGQGLQFDNGATTTGGGFLGHFVDQAQGKYVVGLNNFVVLQCLLNTLAFEVQYNGEAGAAQRVYNLLKQAVTLLLNDYAQRFILIPTPTPRTNGSQPGQENQRPVLRQLILDGIASGDLPRCAAYDIGGDSRLDFPGPNQDGSLSDRYLDYVHYTKDTLQNLIMPYVAGAFSKLAYGSAQPATYRAPYILSVTPAAANVGDTVTVKGRNFSVSSLTSFKLGAVNITDRAISSDTQLTFVVPSGGTTNKLTIGNATGSTLSQVLLTINGTADPYLPAGERYLRNMVESYFVQLGSGTLDSLSNGSRSAGDFVDSGATNAQGYDAIARTGDMFAENTEFRISGVRVDANGTRDAIVGLNPNKAATRYPGLPYLFYVGANPAGGFYVVFKDASGALVATDSPAVTDGMRLGIIRQKVSDGAGGFTYPIRMYTANANGTNLTVFGPVLSNNDPRAFYVVLNPSISGRADYTSTFNAVATT